MTEYIAAIVDSGCKQRIGRFDDHSHMTGIIAKRAVSELHIQRGGVARIASLSWDSPSQDFIVDELSVRAVPRAEFEASPPSCRIVDDGVLYDMSDGSFVVRCDWMDEAERHGQA